MLSKKTACFKTEAGHEAEDQKLLERPGKTSSDED
jgi:hypothetical protein